MPPRQQIPHSTLTQTAALAHFTYDNNDIGAAIASGTFAAEGMVVIPTV